MDIDNIPVGCVTCPEVIGARASGFSSLSVFTEIRAGGFSSLSIFNGIGADANTVVLQLLIHYLAYTFIPSWLSDSYAMHTFKFLFCWSY